MNNNMLYRLANLNWKGPKQDSSPTTADVRVGKAKKDGDRRGISFDRRFKPQLGNMVLVALDYNKKDKQYQLFIKPVTEGGFVASKLSGDCKRFRVNVPVQVANLDSFEGTHKLHVIDEGGMKIYYINEKED